MAFTAEFFPTERSKLYTRLSNKLETAFNLNRKIVSFQANKEEPVYRLFKYKEGFSTELVRFFLSEYAKKPGKLLDPFAGVGTTLFAGKELGWETHGIELLPVGIFVMQTRQAIAQVDPHNLKAAIADLLNNLNKIESYNVHIRHIPITKDAFSSETERLLNIFLSYCDKIEDNNIQTILRFAAFSVLEQISFTRKDGQYLRWDYRSSRELSGKPFNKGKILSFEEAISFKLNQILKDISPTFSLGSLFDENKLHQNTSEVNIIEGSCLERLPHIESDFFDFVITSPPYCNRYDYTRTYALELIFLGQDNEKVRQLRQTMLSCTVENKEKINHLRLLYLSNNNEDKFKKIIDTYNSSSAMNEVNNVLEDLNNQSKLNNNNIPRMVKNYFLEMCFVIFELSRVIKSGGYCVMVNDNVRYGGEEIPVDLILSEFAEDFDFEIEKIFVLPKGKGNSSQQMGTYGRTEIRKCVYVWKKR